MLDSLPRRASLSATTMMRGVAEVASVWRVVAGVGFVHACRTSPDGETLTKRPVATVRPDDIAVLVAHADWALHLSGTDGTVIERVDVSAEADASLRWLEELAALGPRLPDGATSILGDRPVTAGDCLRPAAFMRVQAEGGLAVQGLVPSQERLLVSPGWWVEARADGALTAHLVDETVHVDELAHTTWLALHVAIGEFRRREARRATLIRDAEARAAATYASAIEDVAAGVRGQRTRPATIDDDVLEVDSEAVAQAAAVFGVHEVQARPIHLAAGWWRHENLPLVAHTVDGSPLAVLWRRGSALAVARSRRWRVTRRNEPEIGREALVITPVLSSAPRLRDVFIPGLRASRSDLGLAFILAILGGLGALIVPALTAIVLDQIVPLRDVTWLLGTTVALIGVIIVLAILAIARGTALVRANGRLSVAGASSVWHRVLRLPADYLSRQSTGDLISRLEATDALRPMLADGVLTGAVAALVSLVNLAVLGAVSPLMAAWGAVIVLIQVIFIATLLAAASRATADLLVARRSAAAILLPVIRGIVKIRAARAEARAATRWSRAYADIRTQQRSLARIAALQSVFTVALPMVALIGLVVIAAQAQVSTGSFVAANAAMAVLLSIGLVVASAVRTGMTARITARQLLPLLEEPVEDGIGRVPAPRLIGGIEVRGVSMRYGDGPLVLDDVTLSVRPGSFVAIVGPSGAGKSSLVRLLLGLNRVESGQVFFDGVELDGLNLPSLRRQIGTVLQGNGLFMGTIRTNVAAGRSLTGDEVFAALDRAGVGDYVRSLPMGLDTLVGEAGGTFSGGQRQRILIARALAGDPRVLLFDEATSALDDVSQRVVTESLASIAVTRIVIAHRLTTIADAEHIYVMQAGKVVQDGTMADLLQVDGVFRSMAERQLIEPASTVRGAASAVHVEER